MEQLCNIQEEFAVPKEVVMEVGKRRCCDSEGYASEVAILELAPTQLHPFALRVFLSAYILFRMVLEPANDPYLDLTTKEFLHFYNVWVSSK